MSKVTKLGQSLVAIRVAADKDFNSNSILDLSMPKMEEKASVVLGKDQSS